MSTAKRRSLLLLSAAGILTLLLAMSISALVLSPGTTFSLGKSEVRVPGADTSISGNDVTLSLFRGLIALAFALFPVYIIYSLFSPKGRRRLVRNLITLALLVLFAYYLENHPITPDDGTDEADLGSAAEELGDVTAPPAANFSEEEMPAWISIAVILVASALSVGLLVASLRFLQERKDKADLSLEHLAEAAEDTFASIRAGGDFDTAIIRCYREMTRVVKNQRGIARHTAMTPREFEQFLVSQRLPRDAVATLTRLFEQVRYGSVSTGSADEAAALACLAEIADACKTAQGRYGH